MKRFYILAFVMMVAPMAHADMDADQTFMYDQGGEPEYLDPGKANDSASSPIIFNLFEGLTVPHPLSLRPVPAIVTHWKISPDGKTYTFYLRKDAKWSDGKPVTAHDFAYAWKRVLDPKTAAQAATRLYYLKNGEAYNKGKVTDPNLVGVKAADDYTLVATLENPFPMFLNLTSYYTLYPVRQDVLEKHGDRWTRPENIISNGPFMLSEWVTNKHIIAKKNPNYWDAKTVRLNTVQYIPVEDTVTAVKLFLSKKLDWIRQLPFNMVPQVKDNAEYSGDDLYAMYYYVFNTQRKPFDDVRVRQAFALAIDREKLANDYLHGLVRPANFFYLPPGMPDYPYFRGTEFNPEKARKFLAEAGFKDPSQFPEVTLVYNTNENHKLIAEVIQQMWRNNLGVNVKLQNMEWKVLIKTLNNHDFQIARMGGIPEYIYPNTSMENYLADTEGNLADWKNEQFEALWKKSNLEANPKKRLQIYAQMERIMANEVPSTPLYYYKDHTLLQSYVRGFYRNLSDNHILKWTWISPKDRMPTPWEKVSALARMPLP